MQDMWVQSLGQEDPLEKEMATYSSILAWEIPWTEEPGGLQSIRSQRIRHHWATFSWDCPSTSGLTWERLVFFTLVNFFGLMKVLLVLKSNLSIINVMIIKSFLPQMSNLPVFCMTVTCPNIIGWNNPFFTYWLEISLLSYVMFITQSCRTPFSYPSPGDLSDPGIEPGSPALQVDSLPSELPGKPSYVKFPYIRSISGFISVLLVYLFSLCQNLVYVVHLLSHIQLFATPWTTEHQVSLYFTISLSLLNSCPLSQWCCLTTSSSTAPFSFYLQSLPASGSFPVSWLFESGGKVLKLQLQHKSSMNIQGWFPLGLTGLISLQSKRLSRVVTSTTIQKREFWEAQLSLMVQLQIHTQLLEKL